MAPRYKRSRVSSLQLESSPQSLQDLSCDSTQNSSLDTLQDSSERCKDNPASKKAKFDNRYETATTSPEDVLAKQKLTWSSAVYDHFHPPEILIIGNTVKYVFICKKNPSEKVTRARHDETTSNLIRHADNCGPEDSAMARTMTAFAHGSTYTPSKFRMHIALWIARRHRPFNIIEDPELIEIFSILNNKAAVPSRFTVARDMQEIFNASQGRLIAKLKSYPGKIHLCVDGWTSPNMYSFIGLTVHWVSGGRMQKVILDFVRANKGHTGVYLAGRISECLRMYGIEKQVLAYTLDNASNNNTLINELSDTLDGHQGARTRIRCFAHILNLVVKAILSQFMAKRKDEDSAIQSLEDESDDEEEVPDAQEDVDDDAIDPAVKEHDSAEVDALIEEEVDAAFVESLTDEDINLGRLSIAKLTNLGKKIFNSPTLREALKICCERAKMKLQLMIRAVATRWNTMAELIGRALKIREPLTSLVAEHHSRGARGVRLQRFKLSKQEWELLGQLHPLLDVFLEATKKISQSNVPLLHEVIPIIDIITRVLDDYIDDGTNLPAVRMAACRGRAMLNKYYGVIDESVMYRIAMLLHPRYKSNYFVKAKWPLDWIKTAEELLREQWELLYKPTTAEPARSLPQTTSKAKKYFAELDTIGLDIPASTDPIADWLSTPPIVTVTDPLEFWAKMEAGGHPLARMALDFMSAPAASTDVERAFSHGGLTVSKMRHSLSDQSIRVATVLGSWCEISGLVPHDELVASLNNKSKRPRGKVGEEAIVVDDE